MLARAVREHGLDDEALELTRLAERNAAPDDIDAQVLWRSVRAPILARAGAVAEAESMARVALDMARQTEVPDLHATAWMELAAVMRLAGPGNAARESFHKAIQIYTAKLDLISAQMGRPCWTAHRKQP